jgi:hypothetical protein
VADRGRQREALQARMLLYGTCKAHDCLCAGLLVCTKHQNSEFVAANARYEITVSHVCLYQCPNYSQDVIAKLVTTRVVSQLEPVYVEQDHRYAPGRAAAPDVCHRRRLLPREAVPHSSESILACLEACVAVGPAELERLVDPCTAISCQQGQQSGQGQRQTDCEPRLRGRNGRQQSYRREQHIDRVHPSEEWQ